MVECTRKFIGAGIVEGCSLFLSIYVYSNQLNELNPWGHIWLWNNVAHITLYHRHVFV